MCLNPPPHPNHGRVLSSVTLDGHPGSSVLYACDKGYRLVGVEVRRCIVPGYWEGRPPTCEFVGECPNPGPPDNGFVISEDSTVGMFAYYNCLKGYTLVGSYRRQCVRSRQWSGSHPKCTPGFPACGNLSSIINGTVRLSGVTVDSVAIYTCNEGLVLLGYNQRVCYPDGRWSNEEPRCVKHADQNDCLHPGLIANGQVEISGYIEGSVASYSCDFGHKLVGVSKRRCKLDGRWSDLTPFCNIRENLCGDPPAPVNGLVMVWGNVPGSSATYSCHEGFVLVGEGNRMCVGYGEWTGKAPTCDKACPHLANIFNGAVNISGLLPGSFASFSCRDGYMLVGYSRMSCHKGGVWQDTMPPTCRRISLPVECAPPPNLRYGKVKVTGNSSGSIAHYSCNLGFKLVGSERRICLRNSLWSSTEPVCKRISGNLCSKDINVGNGDVYIDGIVNGSMAMYSCREDYHLVGKKSRKCGSDGKWSGLAPYCSKTPRCGSLSHISNGKVHFRDRTWGSVAYYTCNSKYKLFEEDGSSSVRMCTKYTQWSGSEPRCLHKRCNKPPRQIIPHGFLKVYGLSSGSTGTYDCFKGYRMVGNNTVVCDGNYWHGKLPKCVRIPSTASIHYCYFNLILAIGILISIIIL